MELYRESVVDFYHVHDPIHIEKYSSREKEIKIINYHFDISMLRYLRSRSFPPQIRGSRKRNNKYSISVYVFLFNVLFYILFSLPWY